MLNLRYSQVIPVQAIGFMVGVGCCCESKVIFGELSVE